MNGGTGREDRVQRTEDAGQDHSKSVLIEYMRA